MCSEISTLRRPEEGGPVHLLKAAGLLLDITIYGLGSLTATGLHFFTTACGREVVRETLQMLGTSLSGVWW